MRRVLLPTALIALVMSTGVALAAFPATSPSKVNEVSVAGNPQMVAVDVTDDTAYIVSTGPGVSVYMQTPEASVRSNTVTIRAN